MINLQDDFLIIYKVKGSVKIEHYDMRDVAMDRYVYLALREPYVTLYDNIRNCVESSVIPFKDVKIRELSVQSMLIAL